MILTDLLRLAGQEALKLAHKGQVYRRRRALTLFGRHRHRADPAKALSQLGRNRALPQSGLRLANLHRHVISWATWIRGLRLMEVEYRHVLFETATS